MNTIGEQLRIERDRMRWTQEIMSEQTGISQKTIGFIERGINMPKTTTLKCLISVMDHEAKVRVACALLGVEIKIETLD